MKQVGFIVILLSVCISGYSQSAGRLKGSRFAQVGAGFTGAGPLISVYGGINFDSRIKGGVGGGLGFSNQADINYKYVFVDGYGSFAMYNTNRFFYLNAVAGISFAGDIINDFQSDKIDKKFSFNYGVFGGMEAEFYASKSLLFILGANQRYYIKPEFGNWRIQVTGSLRFILR